MISLVGNGGQWSIKIQRRTLETLYGFWKFDKSMKVYNDATLYDDIRNLLRMGGWTIENGSNTLQVTPGAFETIQGYLDIMKYLVKAETLIQERYLIFMDPDSDTVTKATIRGGTWIEYQTMTMEDWFLGAI